ncbi:hypothetical protein CARUB_v10015499mg [Capsella rubella]|uniref:RING-type E3 ubiquitin transferase n=1 Tax=Capsella rubella TaxID=81985 RepID=R0I2T6_9BRAS|nr:uncharacterized protein LOC17891331 [Capsella rubella]EOA32240.1 hypothetical protein CARUB_v10015499mg [Capsella rubella]
MIFYPHDIFDSTINVKWIYKEDGDLLRRNDKFFIDFQVEYTRADDEEDDLENLESRTVYQTHEFDREWLFGGDGDKTLAFVYHILDLLQVPCYYGIVSTLTEKIVELKMRDELPHVERLQVEMGVVVPRFPGEEDDVDVNFSVAPASDEAVETHLETVVVDGDGGYCVICMDKIRVGPGLEAGRMPCSHVFHRMCGKEWLRNSGICPVCRAVFPS